MTWKTTSDEARLGDVHVDSESKLSLLWIADASM